MTEEDYIKEAQQRYPIGCTIDQRIAYKGNGTTYEIRSDRVVITDFTKPDMNITIDGKGVYSTKNGGIWASVVKYPLNHIKNTYEIY